VAAPLAAAAVLAISHQRLTETDVWEPFEKHADVQRGCDSFVQVSERSPACHWPADAAGGEAVLVGDSNAGHFTEAFVTAANANGMDALVATRSACPFVDVRVVDLEKGSDHESCRAFVDRSTADLVEDPPELVVLAAASDYYIEGGRYELRSPDGSTVYRTSAEKAAAWEAGLARTIDHLTAAGTDVVVVSPVPRLPEGWAPVEMAPFRLRTPSAFDVSVDREEARGSRARAASAERAAAEGRAVVLDVFDDVCPDERCSAYDGAGWRFRDSGHISIATSYALADRFAAAMTEATGGTGS
jgi:hypothetical protein